jgi:AcrR family transcriptional regulator
MVRVDIEGSVPGRRARKKLATRDALRDAAIHLFIERGYAVTTVRDITDFADVSLRTFYRHFESKEDVALVDVADVLEVIYDILVARPQDEAPMTSFSRVIEELATGWTRGLDELSYLYALVEGDYGLNGRFYALLMAHQRRVEELFASRLGLQPHDPDVFAAASAGTMVFLGALVLAVNGDPHQSLFDHAADILVRYARGIDQAAATGPAGTA